MAYNKKGRFDFGNERVSFNRKMYETYQQADQVIDLMGGKTIKTKKGQNSVIPGTLTIKKRSKSGFDVVPIVVSTTMTILTIYRVTKDHWYPIATSGVKRWSDFDFSSLFSLAASQVAGFIELKN